jgi:RNA polymerase sigma-70 factor (sigma-E family)
VLTFDSFLDEHLEPLQHYARALCGDRHSAHDLVADTLVAASERWERIGRTDRPQAYVRRMITNRYIDHTRRYRRTVRAQALLETTGVVRDPITAVEQRQYLDGLLQALPPQQRAALVLRFYLDRPDTEIAAELGVTVGSVRSAISRGLAALRGRTTVDELRSHLR